MSNNSSNRNRSSSKPQTQAKGGASQQDLQESLADREAEVDASAPSSKAEKDLAERERMLKEREQRIQQLETENESLRRQNESDRGFADVNRSSKPQIGPDGGYRFRVASRQKGSKLKAAEVKACDESEAIRYYCCVTEHPDRPGKQIRPEVEQLVAVCLDADKRNERMRHDRRIAQIRRKDAQGNALSDEEIQLLEKEDHARAELQSQNIV